MSTRTRSGDAGWRGPDRGGVPFGFSVPVGAAALVVCCLCAGVLPPGGAVRLGLPALVVGVVAFLSRDFRAGAAVAAIAFLFVDGFFENRFGDLSWHFGDEWRLSALLAVAALGAAMGGIVDAVERRREHVERFAVIEAWANSGSRRGERAEEQPHGAAGPRSVARPRTRRDARPGEREDFAREGGGS